MASPKLTLLSEDEKRRVHTTALELLQEVGLQIQEDEALEVLAGDGARVDRATRRVRFPAELVERALKAAPSQFTLYGRDTKSGVSLRPGSVYYTTNGYATQLYDPGRRARRAISQQDLAWLTRIADAMEQIELYSVLATPHDAPAETNDRYQAAITLIHTRKHFWNTAYGKDGVQDAVRMAAAVRGSREALRRFPLFTLDLTTLSPMTIDKRQASTMIEGARQGLPIGLSPGPIGGATGPVTLAGCLAQATAEVLGAITLVQTVHPGTPVIFTQYTRTMDMATGSVTMGGPEFSLLRAATAEMALHYGLPARGGAMITDSKAPDAQMGAEKMLGCVMASLSGLTILAGAGQADFINTVRPELLLIDNEIIGAVRHLLRGFEVDTETLAADVIARVGPGGNFLAEEHTARHYRQELWFPKLWDRKTWSVWESEGAKNVSRRAWERLQAMKLDVPPLDENVEKEIWEIVREADGRAA